jgi:hypothetical protein
MHAEKYARAVALETVKKEDLILGRKNNFYNYQ